jgi:hypothetical protein
VSIFSFSLDFSFASLNFDHPKKQSRVSLSPIFLAFVYILFIANPNRRWTGASPTKKHIFCGWSKKILQAKVACNTRSKSGGRSALESPRETPPPR